MTWADLAGDAIRVAQQKTAAKLTIPIHEALDRVISTANRGHSTILVTAYGERFSVKGFGQMISAASEAGLPGRCKAHGLQRAARSQRSPGTRRWPRSSALRERPIKNDWQDRQSSDSLKTKVANCLSIKWHTTPMKL
jgi:hypothetical protein